MVLVAGTLLLSRAGGQPRPAGSPAAAPPPRSGAAVAYDPVRGDLVLFGGTANGVALADTWTWDGHRWNRRRPPVVPWTSSTDQAMTYDPVREVVVRYGQQPSSTWSWDGGIWTQGSLSAITQGPIAMAFDPALSAVLLYGAGASGARQLYRWDGLVWTPVSPAGLPDLDGAAMAWDGSRLLLVGSPARQVGGQFVTETWAWDGATWTQLGPAVRLPMGTYAAAYDPANHTVVVLVVTADTQSSETWVWDGSSWRKEHPAHQPPAGRNAAVTYDARANRVVLYGGGLWTWSGTDWTLVEGGAR